MTLEVDVKEKKEKKVILNRGGGPIDAAIGEKIRQYRVARCLSQSALGERIGVKRGQIQKYEKGKNSIPSTRLAALATALNVSTQVLLIIKETDGTIVPRSGISLQTLKTLQRLEKLSVTSRYAIYRLINALYIAEGTVARDQD